jgi:hypothetical protein
MFAGWDSFFLLVGGAAGALIGLLFVVASLPTGIERESRMRGASLYMSPTVFNFAVVVVISGMALAPRLPPAQIAAVTGACGLVGAVHLGLVTGGIGSRNTPAPPHWSDVWCYGVAPLALYLALAGVAAATALASSWAPEAIAGLCLVLLLIGVRNAWDLVTWLAPLGKPAEDSGEHK